MSSFGLCPGTSFFFFFNPSHLTFLTQSYSEKPLSTLSGHTSRVGRLAFHPSGAYLASAGFDGTWRLWDVESSKELMTQEGHSKEVYAVGCQDDGALIASGSVPFSRIKS